MVVKDLFSRTVAVWSKVDAIEGRLVVDALEMAITCRRSEAGLLAHSDRGSQYASEHDLRLLASAGS